MIELRHVTAGYGGAAAISDVSLRLESGCLTAIIGPNGSGKTTLLRAAARQLAPMDGDVLLDGRDIRRFGRREFARAVAFMPQTRSVPDIGVYALVCHGRFPHLGLSRIMGEKDRAAVEAAMALTGTAAWRDRSVASLSGGERQQVYLAMALAGESGAILLDEPTAYLDAPHKFALLSQLRALASGGTAIAVVLHDLAEAMQYGDRIALLSGGTLRAFDTPEALFSSGIADDVFGIRLCRAADGTYYIKAK